MMKLSSTVLTMSKVVPVLLLTVLLSHSKDATTHIASDLEATPIACNADTQTWTNWRDKQIDALLSLFSSSPDNTHRRYLDIGHMTQLSRSIQGYLAKCVNELSAFPKLLENLEKFTGNLARVQGPDHLFGYKVSDQQYVELARPYIDLPPLLLTQEFLWAVSRPETYRKALDLIIKHNETLPDELQWQPLIYDSQFLTSPDNTAYGRFFIHVPTTINNEPVDQWIQFAIATPNTDQTVFCPKKGQYTPDGVTTCSLSIVAVRKTGANKSQVYLMDYRRRYNEDGTIDVRNNIEAKGLTVSCAYCHKSPVLPIHPATVYRFDGNTLVADTSADKNQIPNQLNGNIQSYGPPYFGDFFDPLDYGPGIGPAMDRDPKFLSACAASVDFTGYNLNRLMSCQNCHSGSFMGIINFPQAAHTSIDVEFLQLPDHSIHGLVERYIQTDLMPQPVPHPNLNDAQKRALVNCLMTEYFDPDTRTGLLPDWLRGG